MTPEHIETVLEWMRDKTDGTNDPRVRNIEFELKVKPMELRWTMKKEEQVAKWVQTATGRSRPCSSLHRG